MAGRRWEGEKGRSAMTTMPRASSHAQSRRGLFIFLVLLYLCGTGGHLSWGQESVLDRGELDPYIDAELRRRKSQKK